MTRLTRRTMLAGAAASAALASVPRQALAQGETESHGLSYFGDLKYAPDFPHLSYVNPQARKGGSISVQIGTTEGNQAFETFDTLNIYVLKGNGAAGMPLTFDTLMRRAYDEPDALYGLLAQGVRWSADGQVYRFRLRPEARFHDGSRLTARDVAFTMMLLKEKGHPYYSQRLRGLLNAEAEEDGIVKLTFAPERSRSLPLEVAVLPVFSEAYYRSHDFEAATLQAPLGSGPYKVARLEQGRFIAFERVRDYWGQDLPILRGQHNFDEVRFEYFRDQQVGLEAFKAGVFTVREEYSARNWANAYDFPALREGRVKRETIQDESPSGTQGWYFNLRRDKFKDPRVREALSLAFDFEWTNTNLMFSAYKRTVSFFENTDYKAVGAPSPAELSVLEPWRGKVPAEVFGEPYMPPVSDGSGQDRALLRRADQLLRDAGCRRDGNTLRLPDGQLFQIEFLDRSSSLEAHNQAFIKNLRLLGIDASLRIVDAAQYQRRTDDFDFDIISRRIAMLTTPGEGLREVYGSQAAGTKGTYNVAGIADPAVDALLERIAAASTRDEVVAATRTLDRLLRAGRYWVPQWYSGAHRMAYWDMYDKPAVRPKYDPSNGTPANPSPSVWWYDAEKAQRIGRG